LGAALVLLAMLPVLAVQKYKISCLLPLTILVRSSMKRVASGIEPTTAMKREAHHLPVPDQLFCVRVAADAIA
jgi:hypothetical protein